MLLLAEELIQRVLIADVHPRLDDLSASLTLLWNCESPSLPR
jgi:hypothetical protein